MLEGLVQQFGPQIEEALTNALEGLKTGEGIGLMNAEGKAVTLDTVNPETLSGVQSALTAQLDKVKELRGTKPQPEAKEEVVIVAIPVAVPFQPDFSAFSSN